jgi:serine/threonine protein kinase
MEALRASDPSAVGRYRVLARIGTGGMGIVYLAVAEDGRRVALKIVRVELADDASFRARFRREVDAVRRVGGPRTAGILDADVDSERPYLVTEFVEGGSLRDHVAAFGPLGGDALLVLAAGLAEALVAMDAVGVVHRDLKPSNVLMAPTGPKVVDFGISRAIDAAGVTRTGEVMGSPGWMAPELVLGRRATTAADVFSWGTIVAFAGTGRVPFGEGPSDAVLYRVIHADADLSGLHPALRDVVVLSLDKEASRRPTPHQLLAVVSGRHLAGRGQVVVPTEAWPTGGEGTPVSPLGGTAETEEEPRRGGRVGVTALVLVLLAGILITGAVLLFLHGETRHRSAPSQASTERPALTASSTGRDQLSPRTAGVNYAEAAARMARRSRVDVPPHTP